MFYMCVLGRYSFTFVLYLYNFLTLQAKRLKYHELGAAKAATVKMLGVKKEADDTVNLQEAREER